MSVRPSRRQDPLPEVVGLEPVRVRRVAGAVVPALVERQEPRRLALQLRAEAHLVRRRPRSGRRSGRTRRELARVAVALVLLDRVVDGLLGQAVLQLEGRDRQAVDEQAEVERELRLVAAVAQLARSPSAAPSTCCATASSTAASPRPLLRHAVARQREGRGALRGEPLQRHPPAALQPRRDAARARPRPVHQRPADRHLRAEEQPDQADGRGRRRAVQARPRPAREAVRVRPLRGALRRGRHEVRFCTHLKGKALVVPAVQPGLERRRGQPAEPGRAQDRLPLEAHPHAATG